MALHRRLGGDSPVRLLSGNLQDVLSHVLSLMELVVPDDCETLADAIDEAVRSNASRIVLRAGEHTVGARRGEVAAHGVPGARVGHTVLRVEAKGHLEIVGETGARLKGQLVLASGTRGLLSGVRHADAGDCCVRLEGDAAWAFRDCQFV
jgi:hypothetical protein